jgi:hypothetical protein
MQPSLKSQIWTALFLLSGANLFALETTPTPLTFVALTPLVADTRNATAIPTGHLSYLTIYATG